MKDIYSDTSFIKIPLIGSTEKITVNVKHIISFCPNGVGQTILNITQLSPLSTNLTPNQIAYLISFDESDLHGDPDPTLG